MKRALTVLAVVIVILGVVIAAYFWWVGHQAVLTVGNSPVQNPFGTSGPSFNNTGTGDTGTSSQPGTSVTSTATQIAPRLVRITAGPVAEGMAMLQVRVPTTSSAPTGTSTMQTSSTTPDTEIRYVERQSGNLYTYDFHTATLKRTSNKTIPGVAQASWLSNGAVAYLRYITNDSTNAQHVDTYALPVNGQGGSALNEDLAQVTAIGPSTLLTLTTSDSGSIATLSSPDGSGASTGFSSILSQLRAFDTTGGMFAETLPSASMLGYAFSVTSSGVFVPILGPLKGLSILPNHAGTGVLASYVDDKGVVHLEVLNMKTHTGTPLPTATLADKCVWAANDLSAYCGAPITMPNGTVPDDWYQGAMQFSDRIWKLDFVGQQSVLIANLPSLTASPIDAVSLTIDPNEDVLSFVNRQDGSLWAYDL